MKNFALTGVAGFVAPRHLRAIRETGHQLVAAMDISDSAGILDHYFPQADFFLTSKDFRSALQQYKTSSNAVDYFSVCTPNHTHAAQIELGLEIGAHVICEKPLVLEPEMTNTLSDRQRNSGKQIFNLLQLRLHPSIEALKKKMEVVASSKSDIDLAYVTPRGRWYHSSWKGDQAKSGGIATNIGIHFFDMLIWIFGKVQRSVVHLHDNERAAGFLELEKARVRWFLSINEKDLPGETKQRGEYSSRSLVVDGEKIDFSQGFHDLHTKAYGGILSGNGFGFEEALPSLELVHAIRTQSHAAMNGDVHPMALISH